MAYSDFGPRRSRRRRNVIILILLLVVVGVLMLAVRYRTERREAIDYLTVADDVSRQHADLTDQLGKLLQGLGGEDRPAMEQRLETLATSARDLAKRLDGQVVPRPVAKVSGLLGVAADSWADGIATLREAIIAILDAQDNDVSADITLRDAFDLLRVGDTAYAGAVSALGDVDPEMVPTTFPDVSYTGGSFAPLYDADVLANRLRQQGTLAELVDIALVGNTVPEPVSDNNSKVWSIPASDSLSLEVTVSNTGNVIAEYVTVLVQLQKVGSAEVSDPSSQLIPSIAPGESEILVFDNLQAEPGAVYSLTATASVAGVDDQTDDNTFSLVFERNAQ
jgi:type II secretory pathway pseudopilin PulG